MKWVYITFAVLFTVAQARDWEECRISYYSTVIHFNGSCYFIDKYYSLTYQEAKNTCNEHGMNMFVPQSIEEHNFVMSQTDNMAFTWTGISQRNEKKWDQSSNLSFNKLKWDDTKWSSNAIDRCAVAKKINGKTEIHWTSCEDKHHYICESKNKMEVFNQPPHIDESTVDEDSGEDCDEEPTETTVTTTVATTTDTKVETLKCDDGWLHFKDSCYFIEKTEKADFFESMRQCKNKGATVFAPNTREEYKTLMSNTVVYAYTWTKIPALTQSNTRKFKREQMDWLVKPYDSALNGCNSLIKECCPAYYNGNINAARYVYYYPCD